MVKVGITGGIGSGKTAVCEIWESIGAYILNADDLAKDIMVSDESVRSEIIDAFGPEAYREDGSLNRLYLAAQAFEKDRVDELNRIVHPRMPEAVLPHIERAAGQGYRLFVYEAALLLSNLKPGSLDYVVLVLADEEKRIERVLERDHTTRDQVVERMDKQQNFENLTHKADFVIRNNGNYAELEEKARELYRELVG